MSEHIRVLVIDDREVIRAGIIQVCSGDPEIRIIGEAATWEQARERALAERPSVIILDAGQTHEATVETVRKIHGEMGRVQILVYTDSARWEEATRIVASGANGYLAKAAKLGELTTGIRNVHAGRVFISHTSPEVPAPKNQRTLDRQRRLSDREREVTQMLADGLTNKQVAEKLFLSVKTVETYRYRVMKKNNLRDRADLVQFARTFSEQDIETAPLAQIG